MATAPTSTTWGTWLYKNGNGMRVGLSVSWSSPAWDSTTATATVDIWTTNQYNHDGDATKLSYSGFDDSNTLSFTNNEDRQSIDGDTKRDTRSFTYYYGNGNPTFTATVSETYWGGTTVKPTVSGTYAPPSRPAQPPYAPTMGTLSLSAGIRYIDLSWSASNNRAGIDKYDIYRNGIYWTTNNGESSTTIRDTVGNGVTNNYTVYAHNSVGWSSPSNTPSATTPSLPSAPGSLSADAGIFGKISLSWTASSGNGYDVTYSISRSPSGYSSSTTGLSAIDTTVAPYTDYTYTVTATTSVGSASSSISAKSVGGIVKVWDGASNVVVLPKVWGPTNTTPPITYDWIPAQARMYDGVGSTEDSKWKHGV